MMQFTTNFPNLTNSANVQFVLRLNEAIHHEYPEPHEFSNVTIRVICVIRVETQ